METKPEQVKAQINKVTAPPSDFFLCTGSCSRSSIRKGSSCRAASRLKLPTQPYTIDANKLDPVTPNNPMRMKPTTNVPMAAPRVLKPYRRPIRFVSSVWERATNLTRKGSVAPIKIVGSDKVASDRKTIRGRRAEESRSSIGDIHPVQVDQCDRNAVTAIETSARMSSRNP